MAVLRRIGAGVLLLAAVAAAPTSAPAEPVSTNLTVSAPELKAVFLYNFTRFVKWPEKAHAGPGAPIVIGVQDPEPLRESLQSLEKKTAQNRPIRIRYCRTADDVSGCHVLFVNATASEDRRPLLAKAADQPILTIGDADSFLDEGGIVRFVLLDERLRMRIRPDPAHRVGLEISSRLLQVAEVIHDDKR
jgi:hypothetical protein